MPSPHRTSPPLADPPSANLRRMLVSLVFISALLCVPGVIIFGSSWFDIPRAVPGDTRPLPEWITPSEVRANTRDGTLVKVRVSLDAGTSGNRSAVQRNLYEVGQVLEVSVGARSTPELVGSEGIERLSNDMLTRVNAYLDAKGIGRLNSVAIQDLWYTRP